MPISLPPISLTIPKIDECEVSLFGPGVGECIVIHFGNGRWFIIDSCVDASTRRPVALDYLACLGVDFASVEGLLITHWHTDHINGAAEIVKLCPQALVYIPAALTSEQALLLTELYKKNPFSDFDKEIREYSSILRYLLQNEAFARLRHTKADQSFFFDGALNARMLALSPSDTAHGQALAILTSMAPADGDDRVAVSLPMMPNHNAVAAHFTFGEFSVLLGSDLEVTTAPHTGWHAVLNGTSYQKQSLQKSQLYKVAHHCSSNAHHSGIWQDLLTANPISIATPYSRSGLPRDTDIQRVVALSEALYVTRSNTASKTPKRDKVVEREIQAIVKTIRPVVGSMGHVQVRATREGAITVAGNGVPVCYR